MRLRLLVVVPVLAGVSGLGFAPAFAQTTAPTPATCSFDATTHVARVVVAFGERASVSRGPDRELLVDEVPCGAATMTNVDTIEVLSPGTSTTPETTLVVDLRGGPLAPGFTDEPGTSDEIEIDTDPPPGPSRSVAVRTVEIVGSDGPESIVAGDEGVDLNVTEADDVDADLVEEPSRLRIMTAGGADRVSAAGGGDTGGGTFHPVVVEGGDGDDALSGSDSKNELHGGPGNDVLDGAADSDRLHGDAGDDQILGGPDEDDGGDRVWGGPGSDRLDGGGTETFQTETVRWDGESGAVTVDLAADSVTRTTGDADTITRFQSAVGTDKDDTLLGTTGENILLGGPGTDALDGRDGPDHLEAGGGGGGLTGAGGDDTLLGAAGEDDVRGGDGSDELTGGSGDDRLDAGEGDDEMTGGSGDDSFDGGAGFDVAELSEVRSVDARLTEDRAVFRDGSGEEPIPGVEGLHGGFEDVIIGDAGPNSLVGGRVVGGPGADSLDAVLYDYSDAPSGIVVDGTRALADGWGSRDTLCCRGDDIEGTAFDDRIELFGTGSTRLNGNGGDDTLISGDGSFDRLRGGRGGDTLRAGGGDDELDGGPGADTLDGGANEGSTSRGDVLRWADSTAGVTVDLAKGTAFEGLTRDTFTGFERYEGSPHEDRFMGTEDDDDITPAGGDDTVTGLGGDDVLRAGPGADRWSGGEGRDLLTFAGRPAGAEADLQAARVTQDGDGAADDVAGVEDLTGSAHGDVLGGDAGPNVIDGFAAGPGQWDRLSGRAGDDELRPGRGNGARIPTLEGGPGDDLLAAGGSSLEASYASASSGIVADLSEGTVEDGDGGTDRLADPSGLFDVIGSPHADRITADDRGRRLHGMGGADVLTGGDEADRLFAGEGRDRLDAGGGDDVLELRDDEADVASCGAGTDTGDADAADALADDCERIARPEPAARPGPGPGPQSPAPSPGPQPSPLSPPSPAPPGPGSPPPSDDVTDRPPFPAKLQVARARIDRSERQLSVLAPITARASGRVRVSYRAAGRTERFTAPVDARNRRVRFERRISDRQARLGTGIATITYPGDADTQPQEVRLRAAPRSAGLEAQRPRIVDGRLLVSGRVSRRARGVVRVQLLFEPAGESTRALELTGRISSGRYQIDQRLSPSVLAQIGARRGVVHSYTLFTGYEPARMRGEMASFQVLGAR